MFTEAQIKAAHSKVKTGADFPNYIQEIKALGVIKYTNYVFDGHASFHGNDGFEIVFSPKYPSKVITPKANAVALRANIKIHQQGQTDYLTFCEQAAAAGVDHWVVDTHGLMCTYYDLAGNEIFAEPIPLGSYFHSSDDFKSSDE